MPARSPRRLYKIDEITVTRNVGGTPTEEPIVVKMKRSHAKLIGLTPIPADDPIWEGTFGGSGENAGKKYHRNLGGFRERSYTLVANTGNPYQLEVTGDDGELTTADFKTISIGFPKGCSVIEFFNWIKELPIALETQAIITPAGRRIPLDEVGGGSGD